MFISGITSINRNNLPKTRHQTSSLSFCGKTSFLTLPSKKAQHIKDYDKFLESLSTNLKQRINSLFEKL